MPKSRVPSYPLVPDRSQEDCSKNTRGENLVTRMARWPNKVPAFRSAPHRSLTQNRKRKANGPQAFRNAYRMPTYAGHPLGSVILRDRNKQARTADPAVGQPITLITLSGSLDN